MFICMHYCITDGGLIHSRRFRCSLLYILLEIWTHVIVITGAYVGLQGVKLVILRAKSATEKKTVHSYTLLLNYLRQTLRRDIHMAFERVHSFTIAL